MQRKSSLLTIMQACLFLACSFVTSEVVAANTGKDKAMNVLQIKSPQDFFKYKADGSIIISGHRGGREKGYSENSLDGFKNVLRQLPAMFEIDPRLTKDSVIVLMHDATLERTTTGKGRVSDYTWEELKSVRLKDSEGNVLKYSIPKLEDVIKWSKGKTVVNLDKKDVPMKMIAALIKKLHAEDHVMLTVHNSKDAQFYYKQFPHIMMSAFMRNTKEFTDMVSSGVPCENMIAYVGPTINEENSKIVEELHKKGVRCMISVAPTHDKLSSPELRKAAYLQEINKHPDIIETDIPTEVWGAMGVK